MPFDAGGCDASGQFVLVLLARFIEQVDLVGGCDGDGGVHGHVRYCDPDDLLVPLPKFFEFDFREQTH